jgi:predicted HicB family RNase H-like nuclease
MNNLMEYKGYVGSVEFSADDMLFYGKVQGIRALISYEGTNAQELLDDFHSAVDDYLELCKAENKEPETAYKGEFYIHITPKLHKEVAMYALEHEMTLNTVIEKSLERTLVATY